MGDKCYRYDYRRYRWVPDTVEEYRKCYASPAYCRGLAVCQDRTGERRPCPEKIYILTTGGMVCALNVAHKPVEEKTPAKGTDAKYGVTNVIKNRSPNTLRRMPRRMDRHDDFDYDEDDDD